MDLLDLTLPTVAENLALDEALLEEADSQRAPEDVLRLWESPDFAVIVGRGTQVANEIHEAACEQDAVPIYRRCSGGTSVVAGPGCLMYAMILSYHNKPDLRTVDNAHAYVMQRLQSGLSQLESRIEFRGACDLTLDGRKFSGNALRCKRNCFLYHGTVLYDFPLEKISKYLGTPPRQPDYREGRAHDAFVRNFPATSKGLREVIKDAWQAKGLRQDWPVSATEQLTKAKYELSSWNLRR